MMPMTRRDLEILLDHPDRRDYVVSAYVDLRVTDGFRRGGDVETILRNLGREARASLAEAKARKSLDEALDDVIRMASATEPAARGVACFRGIERGLRHVVALDFAVATRLVIDEEPFVLPLLVQWYTAPRCLAAQVDSHGVRLYERYGGVTEPVASRIRDVADDASRLNFKRQNGHEWHEHLSDLDHDPFLRAGAEEIAAWARGGAFDWVVVFGPSPITAAVVRRLPREVAARVVEGGSIDRSEGLDGVAQRLEAVLAEVQARQVRQVLEEFQGRWKEGHLLADGATETLDALQQGRAEQVLVGPRRDLGGARCPACGYRFGAPIGQCVYCQTPTRTVNALQEILRLAMRQQVPVLILEDAEAARVLSRNGQVAALLRADLNWSRSGGGRVPARFSA
ncbi:MAG: hypothetical protein KatS3mg108_0355 [Isosphaeraceae bacterium]|jgi:hypothetical protein|nr:MAG: hypothetical protein KatS3mg108_0355 [Isosphaeraceae bacterium]